MMTQIARQMMAQVPEREADPAMLDEEVLARFEEITQETRAAGFANGCTPGPRAPRH